MKSRIIISVLVLFITISCKTSQKHPVQSPPFDIDFNLNLPAYSGLQGVGGWAYVPGGNKGIVVYRKSLNVFVSFDRMATTENAADCETGLTINEDNFLILDDPCSNAQYSLYDGSVVSGDVEWGLRLYNTDYDGASTIRIYNF